MQRAHRAAAFALHELERRLDCRHDAFADAVLEREDVVDLSIEAFGPEMHAGRRIDQLTGDAQA